MRPSRYSRQEKVIGTSDGDTIICRWRYGHLLRCDEKRVTPQGNLRNDVIEELIAIAKKAGYTISRREIQYRLQCAKAYTTEAEIRRSSAQYGHWWDLIRAGFPAVEVPPGEADAEPYDPRDRDEIKRDNDRALRTAREERVQMLLPGFYPTMSLNEISKRNDEKRELGQQLVFEADELQPIIDELLEAVDGDGSATFDEAEDILDDETADDE